MEVDGGPALRERQRGSDAEYLSDGIAESIILSLSSLPSLRVMARSTISRYKGRDADPQSVSRELGVRAVLTGRVFHRGDVLVVKTELVDVRDGSQIWGENYSRRISDILAIEEEIAREISEKLRLKVIGEEARDPTRPPTASPGSLPAVSQGTLLLRTSEPPTVCARASSSSARRSISTRNMRSPMPASPTPTTSSAFTCTSRRATAARRRGRPRRRRWSSNRRWRRRGRSSAPRSSTTNETGSACEAGIPQGDRRQARSVCQPATTTASSAGGVGPLPGGSRSVPTRGRDRPSPPSGEDGDRSRACTWPGAMRRRLGILRRLSRWTAASCPRTTSSPGAISS